MDNKSFYNEILTEHNMHPDFKHDLPDADIVLDGVNPSCGDEIQLKLKVKDGVIEDGAWHLDQPYGTIHRLASNGKARGVSRACFDFCTAQIGYLRADTHADNRPMQRLLEAYGFRRCGIIHGAFDGGERIAYDCIAHI